VPRSDVLDARLVLGLDPVLAPDPLGSVGPLDGHDRSHGVLMGMLFEKGLLLLLVVGLRLLASLGFTGT